MRSVPDTGLLTEYGHPAPPTIPRERRYPYMAALLNVDPRYPEQWPTGLFDRLLSVRRHEGERHFRREICRVLGGP